MFGKAGIPSIKAVFLLKLMNSRKRRKCLGPDRKGAPGETIDVLVTGQDKSVATLSVTNPAVTWIIGAVPWRAMPYLADGAGFTPLVSRFIGNRSPELRVRKMAAGNLVRVYKRSSAVMDRRWTAFLAAYSIGKCWREPNRDSTNAFISGE